MNNSGYLCALLIICCSGPVQAQRTLGVSWNIPENESRAIEELNTFEDLGISVLEIRTTPSNRLWDEIQEHELKVWANLGLQFPTAHTFTEGDSAFAGKLMTKAANFLAAAPVQAFNLFQFGALGDPQFEEAATSFFSSLPAEGKPIKHALTISHLPEGPSDVADFYIYDIRLTPGNIKAPDIPMLATIGGYKYHPSDDIQYLLTPFRTVIKQLPLQSKKPVIVESDWLFSMLSRHSRFKESLQSITSTTPAAFPIPKEELPTRHSSPLPAIVLLLIWGILAYHYHMSPLYRKSLFRYLTSHTFFLDDVYHRHIRSLFPAVVITLQHAFLMATVLFCLSVSMWSALGMESIRFHYPYLFFIADANYSIFILTLVATLILSTISILWLSLFHKTTRSLTQIMTLYAWPLQLNFIIGTIAIAVHVSGGTAYLVVTLALLMMIVFLGSFIISAVDAAHFLKGGKLRYLTLTAGIYVLALIAVSSWILWFSDSFWQVIDLSLQL